MPNVARPHAGENPGAGLADAAIRANPAFASLSPPVLDQILSVAAIEQVPPNAVLLHEGELPEALIFALDGLVQLFTGRDRHTVLTILPAPTLVSADVLFGHAPSLVSARALCPCDVGRIAVRDARLLLQREREFAELVSRQLASQWLDMLREMKSFRTHTSLQRLAAWIVAMHAKSAIPGVIELPYDKATLAGRLGMAPETLSRDLARLSRLGVNAKGRRIELADVAILDRLIEGGEKSPGPAAAGRR